MNNIIRMTPEQATIVKKVIRKQCCNYDDGNCIRLDGIEPCPCPQLITRSLICKWFRTAVLPGEPELEQELLQHGECKHCVECGAVYYSASNRSKYCAACAEKIKRRQQAEYARRRRASNKNNI